MVRSNTGLEVQSTVDSFKKPSSDAAAYAVGLAAKPEVDDFTDEWDAVQTSPPLSAKAATVADSVDRTALAEAALPQYMSVARGLC